jgi:ATP/maltotriose-dependent transcriptional regulator MalT
MALEWSLATNVEAGLLMLIGPIQFWFLRGTVREVEDWLERLLAQYDTSTPLRASALAVRSQCIVENGNFEEARRVAEESLKLAQALKDKQIEAFSLLNLGKVISVQGNMETGESFVQESLALYETLGDKPGQVNAIEWLCFNHNDLARSREFAREGLKLSRELGHINSTAYYLSTLAQQTIWIGDLSTYVSDWLEEARTIYEQLGNKTGRANVLSVFGELAYWQGDYESARMFFEESLGMCEQIGSSFCELWARLRLAYVVLRQGDIPQAQTIFENLIRSSEERNNMIRLICAVEGLASVSFNGGQGERAVLLFAWTDAMREKIRHQRPPIEQAFTDSELAAVHSRLNDSAFARLLEKGRGMSIDNALTLALKE